MDSTNGAGTTGHPHAKEQWWLGGNLDTDLTSFTKISSKWILHLTVKWKTRKLPEGNTGENLEDLGYSNDFRYNTKDRFMK